MVVQTAGLLVGSYLLGSVSPSYLLARRLRGIDLRHVGSGNLGARNAGRELGARWGVTVWLLDMVKGAAPVAAAGFLRVSLPAALVAGMAAVAGHIWPAYHGFRGGRGASTALGAAFALLPLQMIGGFVLWVVVSRVSRSLYLGGIVALPTACALGILAHGPSLRAFSPLLVAIPLLVRHVPAVASRIRSRNWRLP